MIKKYSGIFERVFVPKGTVFIQEGDDASSAYLVQAGSLRVFTQTQDHEVELGVLEAGDIFGERSLLFNEPRSASVHAQSDCLLITITRSLFDKKLEKCDPTIKAVVKMLSSRLENSNETIAIKKSSFDDLIVMNKMIYNNVLQALAKDQQEIFKNTILPKLEDYTDILRTFRERNPL